MHRANAAAMQRFVKLIRLALTPIPAAKDWIEIVIIVLAVLGLGGTVSFAVDVKSAATVVLSLVVVLLFVALYRTDIRADLASDEIKNAANLLASRWFRLGQWEVCAAYALVKVGRELADGRGLSETEFAEKLFAGAVEIRQELETFAVGHIPAVEILKEPSLADVVESERISPEPIGSSTKWLSRHDFAYQVYRLSPLGKRVFLFLERSRPVDRFYRRAGSEAA